MRGLFSSKTTKPDALKERLADRLISSVLYAQRRIAGKLNRTTAGWSVLKMRLALYLFCLLFAGSSSIVMVDAIREPVQEKTFTLPVPAIRLPPQSHLPDMEAARQAQLRELEALQRRIDSLPADRVPPQVRAQLEQLKNLVTQ